ncbi:MAG: CBS domain-containing protein [Deltaproteobacteria bacterium]|nr:CBS domain-containing protein [Deltaproteobacteria bacterium]
MMTDSIIEEEAAIAAEQAEEHQGIESRILGRPIGVLPDLRAPIQVDRRASLRSVIDRMNEERIGCVLVVEQGRLVGVFTERDVLTKVVGTAIDLHRTAVEDLMTRDPECLTLDDGIAYALNKMTIGGFRHVPLVDALGRPTGVVAMRHIVEYLVDLFPRSILNLPPSPDLAIARTREGA